MGFFVFVMVLTGMEYYHLFFVAHGNHVVVAPTELLSKYEYQHPIFIFTKIKQNWKQETKQKEVSLFNGYLWILR